MYKICFYFLFPLVAFSQQDWNWQNPLPQGNVLFDIFAINNQTFVAVGANATIMETTNGGSTWDISYASAGKIVNLRSLHHKNNVTYSVGDSGTLVKKTLGGKPVLQHTPTSNILTDVFFVNDNFGCAVGDSGTLLRTTNGGALWSLIPIDKSFSPKKIFFPSLSTGYIVGSNGRILKTTNGGIAWDTIASGTRNDIASVFFVNDSIGWAVGNLIFLKTIDGGKNWVNQFRFALGTDAYFTSLSVGYVTTTDGLLYRTTNGGASWRVDTIAAWQNIKSISFSDANNGWLLSDFVDLRKTTNAGTNWNLISKGNTRIIRDVFFNDTTTGWAVGEAGTIMQTTNSGENWALLNRATNGNLNSAALNIAPDKQVISGCIVGDRGLLMRTLDNGVSWSELPKPTNENLNSVFNISDTYWVAGNNGVVLKSVDGGQNWFSKNIPDTTDLNSVFFINENIGWTAGKLGLIYKTTDGGESWKRISSIFKNELFDVYFINDTTGWFVGANKTILKTNCGGDCLEIDTVAVQSYQISPAPQKTDYYSVKFANDTTGWIVGSGGVILKTNNAGKKWFLTKSPMLNSLFALDFENENVGWVVGSNGTILKTSTGGGTYREPVNPPPPPATPAPVLYQNYPNPIFTTKNIETSIKYEIFEPSHVTLKVYNVLGQYIETLVDEYQEARLYDGVKFSSTNRPSGVYFYVLKTNKGIKTGSMMLVR